MLSVRLKLEDDLVSASEACTITNSFSFFFSKGTFHLWEFLQDNCGIVNITEKQLPFMFFSFSGLQRHNILQSLCTNSKANSRRKIDINLRTHSYLLQDILLRTGKKECDSDNLIVIHKTFVRFKRKWKCCRKILVDISAQKKFMIIKLALAICYPLFFALKEF